MVPRIVSSNYSTLALQCKIEKFETKCVENMRENSPLVRMALLIVEIYLYFSRPASFRLFRGAIVNKWCLVGSTVHENIIQLPILAESIYICGSIVTMLPRNNCVLDS